MLNAQEEAGLLMLTGGTDTGLLVAHLCVASGCERRPNCTVCPFNRCTSFGSLFHLFAKADSKSERKRIMAMINQVIRDTIDREGLE
jgi:hypothetical protein